MKNIRNMIQIFDQDLIWGLGACWGRAWIFNVLMSFGTLSNLGSWSEFRTGSRFEVRSTFQSWSNFRISVQVQHSQLSNSQEREADGVDGGQTGADDSDYPDEDDVPCRICEKEASIICPKM